MSNIVFKPTDDDIQTLCKGKRINYTRYADDLTFSSNNIKRLEEVVDLVKDILPKRGYKINNNKYRFMSGKYAKKVTGLTLNSGHLSIGRDRKRGGPIANDRSTTN